MSRASIRVMLCIALCAVGLSSASADTEVVSVAQPKPGTIVARTRIDAPTAPQASEFFVRLDGSAEIPASKLQNAPPEANSAALLICLDRSGSMGAAAIKAMREILLKTLVPRSGEAQLPMKVAIVAFGTQSTHLLSLTSDPSLVADAVGRLTLEREGKTRLFDAIAGGLAELRSSDAAWKRLLIVSDGNDEGSSISREALIERASLPPAVAVDAVGFGALASSASGVMSTLSGMTGGRFAVAGNRNELADALSRFINQTVPQPLFDIAFDYVPAKDGRKAEAPALLYHPADGPVRSLQLKAEVLAAAPAGGDSSSGKDAGPSNQPPTPVSTSWFGRILESISNAPMVVKIGAGILLLLLVLIAIVLFLRRRKGDEPGLPEMTPPTPLGATRVGDPEPDTAVPPPRTEPSRVHRPTLVAYRWPLPGERQTIAVLNGLSGAAQGLRFRVSKAVTRIGAAPDNEMVLDGDDFISGHHLTLKAEANALYVTDLGSRNGSELNGASFNGATRSLSPGDVVKLGRSSFEVLSPEVAEKPARADFEPRVR